jgi:hypothetical protein
MQTREEDDVLTVAEACQIATIHRGTVYRNKLSAGGFVKRSALAAWMAANGASREVTSRRVASIKEARKTGKSAILPPLDPPLKQTVSQTGS